MFHFVLNDVKRASDYPKGGTQAGFREVVEDDPAGPVRSGLKG